MITHPSVSPVRSREFALRKCTQLSWAECPRSTYIGRGGVGEELSSGLGDIAVVRCL